MTRSFQIAAIALTLAAASVAARAETAPAQSVRVAYAPADLATAAGREAVKADIAAKSDAYCRANPVGGTVAACRQDVSAELSRQIDARTAEYARAQAGRSVQLARR